MLMSKSRLEKFLYALYSLDSSDLPTPLSRIEELYKCLVTGEEPPTFEPLSRVEKYLMAILGVYDVDSLPNPLSRVEVLLYKLATGDDNLDDVKSFLSEHEELLAEIIRNGGAGGNIDIEYVLYTLSTEFNTLYNTAEKPVKSAILKGDTLVNLVKQDEAAFMYTTREAITNGFRYTQEYNSTSMGATRIQWDKETGVNLFKLSTKYYIQCDIKVNKPRVLKVYSSNNTGAQFAYYFLENESTHIKGTFVSDTTEFNYIYFYMSPSSNTEDYMGDTFEIANLIIMEYQEGMENWDIPYFEGMQSVKMPVLTTVGKNLFNVETAKKGYTLSGTTGLETANAKRYITDFIYVKGFTHLAITNPERTQHIWGYDEDKQSIRRLKIDATDGNFTISIPSDIAYVRMPFSAIDQTYITDEFIQNNLVQLEAGEQFSSYEPYKSNILTVNEEVGLRGIGNVQDELDLVTGEVVERIGEVIFDGSVDENWELWATYPEESAIFKLSKENSLKLMKEFDKNGVFKCDKFSTVLQSSLINLGVTYPHAISFFNTDGEYIQLRVYKSLLKSIDVTGLREYLTNEPITVQYKLATESIKTVDLSTVNQDGNNTKLSTFNDITYVTISSEGLIPEAELEVDTKNEEVLNTMSLEMDDISTTQTTLEETSNTQSENVDATMMATTEIYEQLL